jgi:tRNA (mo5U34)-methyltransferase
MTAEMTLDEVRARIAEVPRWFHSIEVAPGVVTPGRPTHRVLQRIGLPAALTGKSVLDVGCSDGFFAFECEKRGADPIVAIDDWSAPYVPGPQGFEVASEILGSKVEFRNMDAQSADAARLGQFDIVLCLGVLYHLKHPLLGLEQLAGLTREACYLETEVTESVINRPSMTFVEGLFRNRDFSTWWVPTISAVQQMGRAAGFQRVEVVKVYDTRAVFICRKDRGLLLEQVLSFGSEEIAGAAPRGSDGVRDLSWDDLWALRQQLTWNRSRIAQQRRVVGVGYGAFRRVLSGVLDVLRAVGLKYR